jgi:hypothetical protein
MWLDQPRSDRGLLSAAPRLSPSQLNSGLFRTERTPGNPRVSGLFVRAGSIGTAYRIFLPMMLLANSEMRLQVASAGEKSGFWTHSRPGSEYLGLGHRFRQQHRSMASPHTLVLLLG